MTYVLIFFLAFWAGFSARRSSICLVRATHELIERKPPKTLFFIIEAMAVALSITIPGIIFFPDLISLATSYNISIYLILGSLLYGFGATVNGGCAIGTINQIMDGKIEYLATIMGMAAGFMFFLYLGFFELLQALRVPMKTDYNFTFLLFLMMFLWTLVIFQIFRFIKKTDQQKMLKFQQYLTSPVARDFIGVFIFGFCSGMIYLLFGHSWDYTQVIISAEETLYYNARFDRSFLPILMTTSALIVGMGVATVLSKSFRYDVAPFKEFILKFLAGILMGFSVGLIPGGNDTIILHGIPGLALHAPVALIFMMGSIAVILLTKRFLKNLCGQDK